mmetsp:Transcript_16937/g.22059  ORF Transcript_16937/g.22059 Transcript_16937/m.22059 type:complete len:98 (+) Transcript_16937:95-388(+)
MKRNWQETTISLTNLERTVNTCSTLPCHGLDERPTNYLLFCLRWPTEAWAMTGQWERALPKYSWSNSLYVSVLAENGHGVDAEQSTLLPSFTASSLC